MLKLTPDIAKQLRTVIQLLPSKELMELHDTLPSTSTKVDEAFLIFMRTTITNVAKTRKDILPLKQPVKLQTKAENAKRSVKQVVKKISESQPEHSDALDSILKLFA